MPQEVSPSPDPTPETCDNDGGTLPETPSAVSQNGPESPRLVTQIDDALHDSLGPPPSAHTPPRHSPANGNPESYDVSDSPEYETPDPSDPYSIHYTIQQHILAITNNGQMLRDVLLEIARACPEPVEGAEDDPEDCPEPRRRVTPYHRRRAASLLLDRLLGTDPNALHSGVCPDCRQKWTAHPGSHDHPEQSIVEEEPFDKEVWEEIIADLNQLEEDGVITLDPNAPKTDHSTYMKWTDEEIAPYAAEVAAKFDAEIALRVERQKQWPEIEERRRKKLEQIYPSHSDDDGDPPDT